ncbi:MAG TPA: hypothetical protein VKA83_08635 [Methylomirabilota bacterium]|nr:hypothetical protein [Methylomirabilota bacterium]
MLKGLVLCGLLMTTWLIVQAAVFHLMAPRKAFASMLASFAPTLPLYLVLYVVTPADLGFLPPAFVGADWRIGLVNGLVLQVLLFLTAGLFYSHADRSITVRLLIELARAPQQRLTLAQMQAVCGVEVLMADRLEIMLANRFLIAQGDRFVLTPKGWIGGSIGVAARKILRMKAL